MKKINVGTYNIIIESGLLKKSHEYIERVLTSLQHKKCFIITDENIDNIHIQDEYYKMGRIYLLLLLSFL